MGVNKKYGRFQTMRNIFPVNKCVVMVIKMETTDDSIQSFTVLTAL